MCFYILNKYTSVDFHAKAQISLTSNLTYINFGGKYLNETRSYFTLHSKSYI